MGRHQRFAAMGMAAAAAAAMPVEPEALGETGPPALAVVVVGHP